MERPELLRSKGMILLLILQAILLTGCRQEKGKNGFYITRWPNGNMKLAANYKENVYHGRVFEWDETGKIYHIGTYNMGQEEGIQKLYYESGRLRMNYEVRNGRRYGLPGTKNCINVADSVH